MYGRDYLRDFWQQNITLRKLRVLIEHLPPDCALARAMNGHAWTAVNYQLANVQDGLNVVATAIRSDPSKQMKMPKPVQRPDTDRVGDVDDVEQTQVKAFIDSLKPPKLELVRDA